MEYIGWRFAPLSGGPIQGYTNSATELFKGSELIDNLAREICQNSLDAKDPNSAESVKVEFNLLEVKRKNYDVFVGLEKCIDGCKRYWRTEMDDKLKTFLNDFDDTMKKEYINCLVISDYNTKGLVGSEKSHLKDMPWTALTNSDGTSYKDSNESGGTYGIGKNAPFACSTLSCVFYNTLDMEGISAFKGVARLATLYNNDNKPTQGVGYYQLNNDDMEEWKPLNDRNTCSFRDLINDTTTGRRNGIGTDIVILGFNEDDWEDSIIKALIKNFLLAILEDKLVLKVGNKEINSKTIGTFYDEVSDNNEIVKFSQIYNAYLNGDLKKISILEENDADFYIKASPEIGKVIARFRNTGMLINTFRINMLQNYAALFIARGQKLNELLRETEPARHNRWDYKIIPKTNKVGRKKAKEAISLIEKKIKEIIKNTYEEEKLDEIDSGLGDVLPDSEDGIEESNSPGDDVMRAKQKIESVMYKKTKQKIDYSSGKKGYGKRESGTAHNKRKHPVPKPIPPKPKVNGEGEDSGVKPSKGMKIIPMKDIGLCRTFPISAANGLYKLVVIPNNQREKIYVKISVVDENDYKHNIEIEYFMLNNRRINSFDKIGPIKLYNGKTEEIIFKTKIKERMLLQMSFEEEFK